MPLIYAAARYAASTAVLICESVRRCSRLECFSSVLKKPTSAIRVDFERLDSSETGVAHDDNHGAYVIVEGPMALDESAHLNFFLRAGVANGRINPVNRYMGTGAVYTLTSDAREHQIGMSIAMAEFGEPFRRLEAAAGNITTARESIVELTYRVSVSDWLTLQPDVQYIRHPGAAAG